MKKLISISVLILAAVSANAQTHALAKVAKVAATPVVHPKLFSKRTLGSVVFSVESGVDVIHGAAHVANIGLSAASVGGKIPVLDSVALFASDGDKYSGKFDGWLEKEEKYLFGSSN